MISLSERLEKIAGFINKGYRVADIGTDHGYIPIYLKQRGISDYIIAGDINEGPLMKMEENMEKHLGDDREGIFIRLGGGLEVIKKGEVDSVVIAGMGGLLISDIIGADMEKSRSVKRFILQPRNAQDKLRKWLLNNGFLIIDEILARESRFVWEIICAEPLKLVEDSDLEKDNFNLSYRCSYGKKASELYFGNNPVQYEVGQCLIRNNDSLLTEFIEKKLVIERNILENAGKSVSEAAFVQKKAAEKKIELLEGILKNVNK